MSPVRARIVTRKSPLAMWQAEHVRDRLLECHPGIEVEISGVRTAADRFLDRPLSAQGGKGMFVKELEEALLSGAADIAVHSVKDVPMTLAAGLCMPAVLAREDARDALVCGRAAALDDLPEGARIGTSSLRRRCQLLGRRPDLRVVDIRGNVGTRIERLDRGELDALVLAAAGLLRLGLRERIRQLLPPELMLPAIGQGALGAECRADDPATLELLEPLHDRDAGVCVEAERAVNQRLYGSCHLPIAAHARLEGGMLHVEALVGRVDGSEIIRRAGTGAAGSARELGDRLGRELLAAGGEAILAGLHASTK
ncbi:MAG TPA: hydroxymethylbilane synthase [Gammaproteobacteria bacterium]|jgi:hydroxymethylbilane synthase